MAKARILPSKEYFEKFVRLDESSPSGLTWVVTTHSGKYKSVVSRKTDTFAGSTRTDGYWQVGIEYVYYPAHRIIMLLSGVEINDLFVDHLDGNGLNNKISNLRVVKASHNSQNRKPMSNNVSGITGVFRYECLNGSKTKVNKYWVARWVENGKKRSKSFSIEKLGETEAKEAATLFRNSKISELNKNGQDYTKRHMGLI